MALKRKVQNNGKKASRYIVGHALLFGVLGLIIFIPVYYFILSLRIKMGYFENPALTTLSEVNWYFIGASFFLIGSGLGAYVGNKKRKRKKRK